MDAVLIVDKPAGMTSHDVVARVRRIVGEKSVGHLGYARSHGDWRAAAGSWPLYPSGAVL